MKFWIVAILVSVTTLFAFQNFEPISVRFLFWRLVEIPKLFLVLASVLVGILIGVSLMLNLERK